MDRLPPSHPFLITAFDAKVFAIERETGKIAWKVKLLTSWTQSGTVELAIDTEVVIACTAKILAFLDYQTGRVIKQVERHDAAAGATTARPTMLLDGGQLFVTGNGTLACYTLDGDLVWDQKFTGEGYGEPAIGVPHKVRQADSLAGK